MVGLFRICAIILQVNVVNYLMFVVENKVRWFGVITPSANIMLNYEIMW